MFSTKTQKREQNASYLLVAIWRKRLGESEDVDEVTRKRRRLCWGVVLLRQEAWDIGLAETLCERDADDRWCSLVRCVLPRTLTNFFYIKNRVTLFNGHSKGMLHHQTDVANGEIRHRRCSSAAARYSVLEKTVIFHIVYLLHNYNRYCIGLLRCS